MGLHRDVVEAADLIENSCEDSHDRRFAGGRCQVQDPQVLDVGALPMRPHQRVMGAPEGDRGMEVLAAVLDQVGGFDYVAVQAQVAPPVLTVPVIHIPAPDLSVYDALRAGAAA